MIRLFDNWKKDRVIAGYTTDYEGGFGNNVAEDEPHYRALANRFNLDLNRMIRISQKHTDQILVATTQNGGEGIVRDNLCEAEDAIITNESELMLCIVTADCVPVFLFDKEKRAIGLSHCGRVGITKDLPRKTVMKMVERYGCNPANIEVILGPYLSQAHHEVEAKDIDMFRDYFASEEIDRFVVSRGVKFDVDMGEAVYISLSKAGVLRENIYDERVCTFDNTELYSWRRDHDPRKRNLSFLYLE